MTPREAWNAKVLLELTRLTAHYDSLGTRSIDSLVGVAKGGSRHLLESPMFDSHDALKLACALVMLVREMQLEDKPDGPPRVP